MFVCEYHILAFACGQFVRLPCMGTAIWLKIPLATGRSYLVVALGRHQQWPLCTSPMPTEGPRASATMARIYSGAVGRRPAVGAWQAHPLGVGLLTRLQPTFPNCRNWSGSPTSPTQGRGRSPGCCHPRATTQSGSPGRGSGHGSRKSGRSVCKDRCCW